MCIINYTKWMYFTITCLINIWNICRMKFEEKGKERCRYSYRCNLVGARWAKDPSTLFLPKGAFTRIPQVDQRGWIYQSEPCKQFISTEVINGVDGWTSWRWPTFVQHRWFTLGESPQITRLCLLSLCMVLFLIIIRKTVLETSLNDFYTYLDLHLSIQLTMCLMHLTC